MVQRAYTVAVSVAGLRFAVSIPKDQYDMRETKRHYFIFFNY